VLVEVEEIQTYQIILELQELLQQSLGVLQQSLVVVAVLVKLLENLVDLAVVKEDQAHLE
jgi:hypothetical protein